MTENVTCDTGSLAVYDTSEFRPEAHTLDVEIVRSAEKAYNALYSSLKAVTSLTEQEMSTRKLEHKVIDYSADPNIVELPAPTVEIPRFHKPPEKPEMTRWEKFAKEKGIKKKKRSRLVWSDEVKDWVPRHGRGSKNNLKEELDIIREVKANDHENPFERDKRERKIRKKAQDIRELKNELRRKKSEGGAAGAKVSGFDSKKVAIDKSLKNVGYANASMGKFAVKSKDDKKQLRKTEAKPNHIKLEDERKRNQNILGKILK